MQDSQLRPFRALTLMEGISGDDTEIYNSFKVIAHMRTTYMSADHSAIDTALDGMCALAANKEEFEKDANELVTIIKGNLRDQEHLELIESHVDYLQTNFEDSKRIYAASLERERIESQEIYQSGYQEYIARLQRTADLYSQYEDYEDNGDESEQDTYKKLEKPIVSVYYNGNEWNFQSNGVNVAISKIHDERTYIVDGNSVVIQDGDLVGTIDFTPGGSVSFAAEKMLLVLAKGGRGVADFLERIYDTQKFPEEERLPYDIKLIVGQTNRRMGEMATRFGFKLTDESKPKEGEKGNPEDSVVVVATLRDIKEAYDKFKESKIGEKILARALREKVIVPDEEEAVAT